MCQWKGSRSEVGAHEAECHFRALSSVIASLQSRIQTYESHIKELESRPGVELTEENYQKLVRAHNKRRETDIKFNFPTPGYTGLPTESILKDWETKNDDINSLVVNLARWCD